MELLVRLEQLVLQALTPLLQVPQARLVRRDQRGHLELIARYQARPGQLARLARPVRVDQLQVQQVQQALLDQQAQLVALGHLLRYPVLPDLLVRAEPQELPVPRGLPEPLEVRAKKVVYGIISIVLRQIPTRVVEVLVLITLPRFLLPRCSLTSLTIILMTFRPL